MSGHQCAQTPPLSTRVTVRPIWDKTEKDFSWFYVKTASFHTKITGFLYENRNERSLARMVAPMFAHTCRAQFLYKVNIMPTCIYYSSVY